MLSQYRGFLLSGCLMYQFNFMCASIFVVCNFERMHQPSICQPKFIKSFVFFAYLVGWTVYMDCCKCGINGFSHWIFTEYTRLWKFSHMRHNECDILRPSLKPFRIISNQFIYLIFQPLWICIFLRSWSNPLGLGKNLLSAMEASGYLYSLYILI